MLKSEIKKNSKSSPINLYQLSKVGFAISGTIADGVNTTSAAVRVSYHSDPKEQRFQQQKSKWILYLN